jgi:hypothetical protein
MICKAGFKFSTAPSSAKTGAPYNTKQETMSANNFIFINFPPYSELSIKTAVYRPQEAQFSHAAEQRFLVIASIYVQESKPLIFTEPLGK